MLDAEEQGAQHPEDEPKTVVISYKQFDVCRLSDVYLTILCFAKSFGKHGIA